MNRLLSHIRPSDQFSISIESSISISPSDILFLSVSRLIVLIVGHKCSGIWGKCKVEVEHWHSIWASRVLGGWCKDANAGASGKCRGISLQSLETKGFSMLDACLSPTHCPDPCGLGTCVADPVSTGIDNNDTCIITFSSVLVAFAFRESTLGLSPTLNSPTVVCSSCQGSF